MRSWRERLQALAIAVTFAEQGEWETAQSFLAPRDPKRRKSTVDDKPRSRSGVRKTVYRV